MQRVTLTSARNLDFVQGLSCYEQAVSYDDLHSLAKDQPTLYVDFSGDLHLRDKVHQHFAEGLTYSCFAGSAQCTDEAQLTAIQGPAPVFFFAPIQIRKRNAEWGPERVSSHIGDGLQRFYRQVADPVKPLLEVVVSDGYAAAQQLISDLYPGKVAPDEGHIIKL